MRPCGSTPEHDGPISNTCERPARVWAPVFSMSKLIGVDTFELLGEFLNGVCRDFGDLPDAVLVALHVLDLGVEGDERRDTDQRLGPIVEPERPGGVVAGLQLMIDIGAGDLQVGPQSPGLKAGVPTRLFDGIGRLQ